MKSILVVIAVWVAIAVNVGRTDTPEALAKKSGCLECHRVDRSETGPAFRSVAAKYRADRKDFDLTFMAVSSAGDLPDRRRAAVVVALVGEDLHVRIFDADGNRVADK